MDSPVVAANRGLFEMESYAYCNMLVIAITCWVSCLGFHAAGPKSFLLYPVS